MKYAINYVLGRDNRVLVVDATDRDDAYSDARSWLVQRRLFSASLQGTCRPASQDDIDTFATFEGGPVMSCTHPESIASGFCPDCETSSTLRQSAQPDGWMGIIDCLGYLVCRNCNEAGHGHRLEGYVFGPPHSEERCDYCASILGNLGEP